MINLIIACLNVSFKKLIVWLQLNPKLIASDYITTGRPLGRTKGVHSCVTPQGALSGGCEAWLANPSSLTYFNTNGRVSGLGETSWYGLSPVRRQAITWTNAALLSILGTLGTNFNEVRIEKNAFEKCRLWNGGHFVKG